MKDITNTYAVYQPLVWTPLFAVLFLLLWRSFFFELHDFSNAYFAAFFLRENAFDIGIYDALYFNQNLANKGFSNYFVAYYPNTPFLAFFFLPFSFLEPEIAKLIFNFLSAGLFVFALFRLKKIIPYPDKILLILPLVFFTAIKSNLYFGQVYLLIFFLLTEGLIVCYKEENLQKIKLGFYWGLAILLKVFPVLFVLLLFVQKQFKTLLFLGGFCLFFVVFSLWKIDLTEWIYYLTEVFPKSSNGEYYDGFTPKAKSATMLLKNLFVEDALLNPQPLFASYSAYLIAQAIYKTNILAALLLFSYKKIQNWLLHISIWIIGTILLSPGWSSYASILLILPFLVVCSSAEISLKNKVLFSILVGIYSNIPVQYFWELPLLLKFPKVYLLLSIFVYYWYLFRTENVSTWTLKLGVYWSIFMLLATISFLGNYPSSNQYVLDKEEHILISDYHIKNGYLEYEYWTIPKPQIIKTNILVNSFSSTGLSIENNQIYYNKKQLTNSKSKKRKPMLINEKEIIYLSDQNRGIGFYTILKIPVP